MDMGAAAGALEHPGYEDLVFLEGMAADRAYSGPVSVEAVDAALDVHKPVLAAVEGREGKGFYQFPLPELDRAYRTGLGSAGEAFAPGFPAPPLGAYSEPESPPAGGFNADVEEEGITEPEEGCGGDDK
jgi:hypothetical protein